MNSSDKIMNVIVFGNPEGTLKNTGKCTHEYDDFIKDVFYPKHISSHNREEYKPIDFVEYENGTETSMGNYSLDE